MQDENNTKNNKNTEQTTKKLKIGLFIDTFFPMVDGVINVVDNYARRLCEKYDVTVFTVKPRKKGYDDGKFPYKVVRCDRIKTSFLDYDMPIPSLDMKFKKELNSGDFDIIHVHSPFAVGKLGISYAKRHKIPAVATLHSQYYKDFLRESHSKVLSKTLLRGVINAFDKCDECWAVNSEVGRIYYEEYGLKNLPLTRNNGTDMKPLENCDNEIAGLRKTYGITTNEKVLLFVGRITNLKNVFFIANSLKILKDQNFKFKMLFVGSGPDEEKLKKKVADYGLSDDVVFTGRITDKHVLSLHYKLADLFLFPSLYDCSSLVQIEAAAQKTPALFLQGSATSATVTDGVNGYLSEATPPPFARRIVQIFKDTEDYNRICENCFNDLFVGWDDAVALAEKDYYRLIDLKKQQTKK